MPWNAAQTRLFAAAAHNADIAKAHGMSQAKARKMEMESTPEQRSKAMKGRSLKRRTPPATRTVLS